MEIVLYPYKTLKRPFLHLSLLLFVKSILCMNHAFSIDTDPVTSSRGQRNRARTDEWDMTVEYDFSCPSDELKHLVHESGHLVNAKLTDS